MTAIFDQLASVWQQALTIWVAGGWAMIAIALVALIMFALGLHIDLRLRSRGFNATPERTWRRWIDEPSERRGPIGRLLDGIDGAGSLKDLAARFKGLRAAEAAAFDRDLRVMRICVSVAPLLGLFGTVTGMLDTFHALASGSGGEKTMAMVASGISEALITTMTGLVVALPGLFFQYRLARLCERYKAFLAHLESVCMQHRFRAGRSHSSARRAAAAGQLHTTPSIAPA